MIQLDRQLRNSRFGLRKDVLRLVYVELGCGAALIFRCRDRQRLLLFNNVLARDFDLRLQRADADIGGRDITQQCREHVVVIRDRRQIGCIGGFDRTTKLAPKVEFPIDGEAERVAPKVLCNARWKPSTKI